MDQKFFHFSFIILFTALMAIRAYYHRLSVKYGGRAEFREKKFLRGVVSLPFIFILVVFMFDPRFLYFARVDMPDWLQWLGFTLGATSIFLTIWVHANLGVNFSSILHVREKHTLSTSGPYKWVRHPMYTVLFMHFLGILFLTENLLIGGAIISVFIFVISKRLKNEEKLMLDTFGEEYRQYMSQTGLFFPKF